MAGRKNLFLKRTFPSARLQQLPAASAVGNTPVMMAK
jgi:hypothetical protein